MFKRISGDAFGEILETGKAVKKQASQIAPAKIIKTALEQVQGGKAVSGADAVPPGLEDLKAKKPTVSQLVKMRQDDAIKTSSQIDSTKIALNQLIRQRYQTLQQEVLKDEKEREQDEFERQKEDAQAKEKEKKEEEKKRRGLGGIFGKRKKKQKGLGLFVKQKTGSKELGQVKAG